MYNIVTKVHIMLLHIMRLQENLQLQVKLHVEIISMIAWYNHNDPFVCDIILLLPFLQCRECYDPK